MKSQLGPWHYSSFLLSISVIQWLLNAETSHPTSSPPHRLTRFFTTLHAALKNPSRAVFQFYPSSDDQIQLITSIAQKAGFGGGIVVDYPNSNKAKKVFLCLFVGGGGSSQHLPKGLDGEAVEDGKVRYERRREKDHKKDRGKKRKSAKVQDRDWILKKKEVSLLALQTCVTFNFAFNLLAVPQTRKRRCTEGFQVHRSQAQGCLLISGCILV